MTSPWDKSNGVNWSFLLKNLVAVTNFGPCDWSHEFKPVWLVPRSTSCKLFVGQVPGTSPFVQTFQGNSCRDQSQGVVPLCVCYLQSLVEVLLVLQLVVPNDMSLNTVESRWWDGHHQWATESYQCNMTLVTWIQALLVRGRGNEILSGCLRLPQLPVKMLSVAQSVQTVGKIFCILMILT